jgi:hypothetical protein
MPPLLNGLLEIKMLCNPFILFFQYLKKSPNGLLFSVGKVFRLDVRKTLPFVALAWLG